MMKLQIVKTIVLKLIFLSDNCLCAEVAPSSNATAHFNSYDNTERNFYTDYAGIKFQIFFI